jgi:hypothetical protein
MTDLRFIGFFALQRDEERMQVALTTSISDVL